MTDLIRSACLTSSSRDRRLLGLDPLRLLDSCGIDRRCLADPDIKLPANALGRLLEASAKAAKVEDFGLRLAETRTLSILGPVGLLVREEATVRDAIGSLMRYIRLHNEALYLRLEEHGGQANISLEIRIERPVPVRQGVELAVGVLYRILRSLRGRSGGRWCVSPMTPRGGATAIAGCSAAASASTTISTASSAARATSIARYPLRTPRSHAMPAGIWKRCWPAPMPERPTRCENSSGCNLPPAVAPSNRWRGSSAWTDARSIVSSPRSSSPSRRSSKRCARKSPRARCRAGSVPLARLPA